jgi:hypothetical protein
VSFSFPFRVGRPVHRNVRFERRLTLTKHSHNLNGRLTDSSAHTQFHHAPTRSGAPSKRACHGTWTPSFDFTSCFAWICKPTTMSCHGTRTVIRCNGSPNSNADYLWLQCSTVGSYSSNLLSCLSSLFPFFFVGSICSCDVPVP